MKRVGSVLFLVLLESSFGLFMYDILLVLHNITRITRYYSYTCIMYSIFIYIKTNYLGLNAISFWIEKNRNLILSRFTKKIFQKL